MATLVAVRAKTGELWKLEDYAMSEGKPCSQISLENLLSPDGAASFVIQVSEADSPYQHLIPFPGGISYLTYDTTDPGEASAPVEFDPAVFAAQVQAIMKPVQEWLNGFTKPRCFVPNLNIDLPEESLNEQTR